MILHGEDKKPNPEKLTAASTAAATMDSGGGSEP